MNQRLMSRALLLVSVLAAGCDGCGDHGATGLDLAANDLAIPDLAIPDLAIPDLAISDSAISDSATDLVMPDLTPPIDLAGCTPCSGVCVELDTDPSNCGACGHLCGCGSTSCTAGVCDPQILAPAQTGPYAIVVDSATVYWSSDGTGDVQSVATIGGAATQLLKNVPVIRGMAADATHLYLTRTNFNVVEIGPRAGGNVQNFSPSAEPTPWGIASDGTTLFWVDLGSANLRAQALGTNSVSSIETGQAGLTAVAVDDTYVYWTVVGAVVRALKAGGAITTVAGSLQQPNGLAVDGSNVYWTDAGNGSVNSRPKDGSGSTTPIASGQLTPTNLAVDGSNVYWTEHGGGNVWRAPLGGGTATPIAIHQSAPSTIALDADCVYFVDFGSGAASDGSVNRSPKL